MVLAAPAFIEAYSVLTRLPPPRRISPLGGRQLLNRLMVKVSEFVALEPEDYRRLIENAPERAISGGGIYDAVIGACAIAARVDAILTFNDRQFLRLDLPGIQIVVPQ